MDDNDDDNSDINAAIDPVSKAPSLTEHHAALMIEDLAFGRHGNVERDNALSPGETIDRFELDRLC